MNSEHQEQSALIRWSRLAACEFPALAWLYAIPNGGRRDGATAAQMQREGVVAGVADLCLPVAYRDVPGLYIEMKTVTGKQSPAQQAFEQFVTAQRYRYILARSWIDAALMSPA